MKPLNSEELVLNSLTRTMGRIFRHDAKGQQTLVCEATRLGNGLWATVGDRGIYGGVVYGEYQGTLVLVDLWLHPEDGRDPMPIQWSSQLAVKPITVLFVPQDVVKDTISLQTASMPSNFDKDYNKFYRLGGTGAVYEGTVYERPWPQRYDLDRDNATAIVVRGDMGYGMPVTACGGPVVDDQGRLLGVIVGKDWGVDSSHAGFYVPWDLIKPCVDLLNMLVERRARRESEWRLNIETVSHRSNDVYFD